MFFSVCAESLVRKGGNNLKAQLHEIDEQIEPKYCSDDRPDVADVDIVLDRYFQLITKANGSGYYLVNFRLF